jgi:hypothetical protein
VTLKSAEIARSLFSTLMAFVLSWNYRIRSICEFWIFWDIENWQMAMDLLF